MNLRRYIANGVLTCALVTVLGCFGCTVHAGYYDADHRDYHRWGPGEVEPYGRWEVETHREHVDYNKRKNEDKQAYWNWRHDHP